MSFIILDSGVNYIDIGKSFIELSIVIRLVINRIVVRTVDL